MKASRKILAYIHEYAASAFPQSLVDIPQAALGGGIEIGLVTGLESVDHLAPAQQLVSL